MSERTRGLLLILIMVSASLVVVAITIFVLYDTAFEEHRLRLLETARSRARLIEAIARFDEVYSRGFPGGSRRATLSQVMDAHARFKGFGETGEFTLAHREGDTIVFVLSHRHSEVEYPTPVPFRSQLAEPMRMALKGHSGTIVGLDYRGEKVLAAFEPISEIDLGLVAKIDLSEVRAPFFRASLVAGCATLLTVLIGAWGLVRINRPVIRKLENTARELSIRNRIGQIFLSFPDDEMYARVLEVILEAFDSKYGVFGYLDENGSFVVPSMTRHIWDQCQVPDKDIVFPRETWGDSTWPTAFREKRAIYSNEPSTHIPEGHVPMSRHISFPILHHGEPIGLFQVANRTTDYDDQDILLFEMISDHIAPILHARLERDRKERQRRKAQEELRLTNMRLQGEVEERRKVEVALLESEESLKRQFAELSHIYNTSPVGLCLLDTDLRYVRINEALAEINGSSVEAHIGKTLADIIPDLAPELAEVYRDVLETGEPVLGSEVHGVTPARPDEERDWLVSYYPVLDQDGSTIGLGTVVQDITQVKRAEERIRASLREKEVLLREIHHRVKNNLQLVTSLLRLQAARIEEKSQRDAFEDSQSRIRSMALIHEKLYRSEDLARIDFQGYAEDLVQDLFRTYGVTGSRVCLSMEVEDLQLGVSHAIPCGLILSEIVSNSLKYAFPNNNSGEIRISLCSVDGDLLELVVGDDGVGLPEDKDMETTESLGLRLVKILVEDQLGGEIEVNREKGTEYRIRMKRAEESEGT